MNQHTPAEPPWFAQRLAALDFECSDKVPETARIVSCALILVGGGLPTDTRTWLVNPGIAQEPGAIAVHKLTDEHLAEHGQPTAEAVGEIAKSVAEVVAAGTPLVGHNLGSFDLNLLNHECLRHLGDTLEGVCRQPLTRVIDTMVLDKHAAPYRRLVAAAPGPDGRCGMKRPFVLRSRHDVKVADLTATADWLREQCDAIAKERDAFKRAAETADEKHNDACIVNECLTEDLAKVRKQLAASQEAEGSLAAQIHVLVGHDLPPEVGLNPMADVIRERDAERQRADRLQRQLDDATFLPPGRVEDSGRWQPGYQQPKPTKETTP